MPSPRKVDPAALTLRLQAQGPQTAQALAAAAAADRSRISRALTALGPAIVRLGTTRGATYALRRSIRALGDTFPIRRIDADGRPQDWAEITALHGGWRLTWTDAANPPAWADQLLGLGGFSEGFPFFLSEVRPQGFLGRAIARALPPALGLDPDPRNWPTDDDTLVYLASEGDDLSGDLIVGDIPLRRFQERLLAPPAPLPESARATRYPELAATAASSGVAGSSVEGEQPKFLVTLAPVERVDPNALYASAGGTGVPPVIDGEASPRAAPSASSPSDSDSGSVLPAPRPPLPTPVLVKFTDLLSTPTGRRWGDLYIAEAIAQALLHAHGEAHAAPRLVHAGDRIFLETPRYDRVGAHGRRGVVSLRALHDAFDGPDSNQWPAVAAHLHARGLIDAPALRSTRLRHAFGRLIGNSDMHFGNLAFWFDDALPFRLAPAYDMLPMQWAPTVGNATPSPDFAPPLPLPADREIWHEAAALAAEFWRLVAANPLISPPFAAIARSAGETLAHLRAVA